MKIVLNLVLIAVIASACSTNSRSNREMASTSNCSLEAHPTKALFRVMTKGSPFNEFWYAKDDAEVLLNKLEKTSRCQ